MSIFACPDEDLIWRQKEIPSPLQELGANLAIWLESRAGTGAGPAVPTWFNKVANGNALQATSPTAPVLVPRSFGRHPGVAFLAADSGLELTLSVPWAIGDRPYMWCRAKLEGIDHTPGQVHTLFQALADPFVGGDAIEFDAEASGSFDVNAYWNLNSTVQETFITLPPPDGDLELLEPSGHVIQAATQQARALVVDGVALDAPGAQPALVGPINRIFIGRDLNSLASRLWNIGVLVFSYTQPTAAQIANVAEYCANYQTIL